MTKPHGVVVKVIRIGRGGAALYIPRELAQKLKIEPGDQFDFWVHAGAEADLVARRIN